MPDYVCAGQPDTNRGFYWQLLTVFQVFFGKMLLKPRFCKQHNKDLEQNPLAPTSTAYTSTSQTLKFIADFNGKYLLILWSCHFSIFSSQGQVNSVTITFFCWIRIMVMSGRNSVSAICKGKLFFLSKWAIRIQLALLCNVPHVRSLLGFDLGTFLDKFDKTLFFALPQFYSANKSF